MHIIYTTYTHNRCYVLQQLQRMSPPRSKSWRERERLASQAMQEDLAPLGPDPGRDLILMGVEAATN